MVHGVSNFTFTDLIRGDIIETACSKYILRFRFYPLLLMIDSVLMLGICIVMPECSFEVK
jgi:hypothetical protein